MMRAVLLAAVATVALPSFAALPLEKETTRQSSLSTRVVLLGTGTPNADPDRSGPSLAIVVDDAAYIVDSGPGVVRRAAGAARKGIKGLEPRNLKTVFITHLH